MELKLLARTQVIPMLPVVSNIYIRKNLMGVSATIDLFSYQQIDTYFFPLTIYIFFLDEIHAKPKGIGTQFRQASYLDVTSIDKIL